MTERDTAPSAVVNPADDPDATTRVEGRPQFSYPEDLGEIDSGDDDDDDFAPRPRYKVGALTVILAALLVAGGGFLVGAQIQKHEGGSGTSSTAAAFARRAAAGGFAGGAAGAGGTGGFAGGAGGGAGAGTRTGSGATGGTSTPAVPAAIGTVVSVSGQTMVLKNLGGQQVTVHLSATTTVTKTIGAADLAAGQTVAVTGTAAADGSVTATNVKIQ